VSKINSKEPLVITEDLGKVFGDFIALQPLNVKVFAGEFFGVFGPNGAGKSTFIRLLTGQLQASTGSAEVLGINVGKKYSMPSIPPNRKVDESSNLEREEE